MQKSDYKNMWVYLEHDGKTIQPVSLELCCEIRKLCDTTSEKLAAVVIGKLPKSELKKVRECGVDEIITVTGTGYEDYSTEAWANVFTVLSRKYNPSAVFVGGTVNGRDFAPRFAVQVNTGCTSDAVELVYDEKTGDIEFIEPAVGGKIMAVITVPVLRPQVGTIRPGTFQYAPAGEREVREISETIDFPVAKITMKTLEFRADAFDAALNIADADVIVCVGNGLKSEESLPKYRELAELLGGKLACTRPLVDREVLNYKLQIGQSGVVVKPKLYIGFGVSGAVNHVTGMKDADLKIVVNTDPDAAMFSYCDYGIVGDMEEVCDRMIETVKARKGLV